MQLLKSQSCKLTAHVLTRNIKTQDAVKVSACRNFSLLTSNPRWIMNDTEQTVQDDEWRGIGIYITSAMSRWLYANDYTIYCKLGRRDALTQTRRPPKVWASGTVGAQLGCASDPLTIPSPVSPRWTTCNDFFKLLDGNSYPVQVRQYYLHRLLVILQVKKTTFRVSPETQDVSSNSSTVVNSNTILFSTKIGKN